MARTLKTKGFDRILQEIDGKQRDLGELRARLSVRRSRHLPESYYDQNDKDARARAAIEEQEIEQIAAQVEELAEEVEELWTRAADTQDAAGRLEGGDDDLLREIDALSTRKTLLDEAHRNRHAEDAHDAVDTLIAFNRERLDALLAAPSIGPAELERIIAVWPVTDPNLAKALHDTVDRRNDYAPGTRDEYREQAELLGRQVQRRRAELDLRAEERAVAEAEAERAAAEARLAAVEA